MRKFISIVLVVATLLVAASLISCSSDNSDNGYGVSKKMDSEIRTALVGCHAYTRYSGDYVQIAFEYTFNTETYVYKEAYWGLLGGEKWEEQCRTCTFHVTPTKIVISPSEHEFYYIFENGKITYLDDEPYGAH